MCDDGDDVDANERGKTKMIAGAGLFWWGLKWERDRAKSETGTRIALLRCGLSSPQNKLEIGKRSI